MLPSWIPLVNSHLLRECEHYSSYMKANKATERSHSLFTLSAQLKYPFLGMDFFDLLTACQGSRKRPRRKHQEPYFRGKEKRMEAFLLLLPSHLSLFTCTPSLWWAFLTPFTSLRILNCFPTQGLSHAVPSDWSTPFFTSVSQSLNCHGNLNFNVTYSPRNSLLTQSQMCSPNPGFSLK